MGRQFYSISDGEIVAIGHVVVDATCSITVAAMRKRFLRQPIFANHLFSFSRYLFFEENISGESKRSRSQFRRQILQFNYFFRNQSPIGTSITKPAFQSISDSQCQFQTRVNQVGNRIVGFCQRIDRQVRRCRIVITCWNTRTTSLLLLSFL